MPAHLRKSENLLNYITGLAGCALVVYGLYAAIIQGSPYWYSYFIAGLFLFSDSCDAFLNHDSNLTRLCRQTWRTPVYTYLVYVAGALGVDLLFGSYIGHLWVYPHFDFTEKIINVVLIGYPLLFFSCAAFYRILLKLLRNILHCEPETTLSFYRLGIIILFITIFSTCFPVLYFWLFGRMHVQAVIIICGLIGILSLSPLSLILGHKSLLLGILNRDWPVILTLLISIPFNALVNELPNTFAWEWRYQNMHFTSLEMLGVPVIVLTVGWAYLTIFGISGNELFFHASK